MNTEAASTIPLDAAVLPDASAIKLIIEVETTVPDLEGELRRILREMTELYFRVESIKRCQGKVRPEYVSHFTALQERARAILSRHLGHKVESFKWDTDKFLTPEEVAAIFAPQG